MKIELSDRQYKWLTEMLERELWQSDMRLRSVKDDRAIYKYTERSKWLTDILKALSEPH